MKKHAESADAPTRNLILESARRQFLALGFQGASIRKIASDAGFTPGALYGYFPSKEALFYALTDPLIGRIMDKLNEIESAMMALPEAQRLLGMSGVFYARIPELVDIIFEDREVVELVLSGSKGTKYEHFLSELVRRDTRAISEAMKTTSNRDIQPMEAQTMEILIEGYMATLFHLIVSGRDKQTVCQGMELVGRIYEAGMLELMKKGGAES